MAEVFAAKLYGADGFEKDLVIKQILPQYARDPEFVQSFVAEAKIAVSLTHANIVSIYELGRVDGTYFIAMEYVEGQDVFALLDAARRQNDPLTPGLALLIVEEVCRGLDYAHRKTGPDGLPLGLVHRDLNPRNVLVAREGDVKILDFGIAKTGHKSAAMPKTRAGVVKGTTGYMSPEQATGQAIDHRTDLYQAGLLLFECLTGQALFWRPEDQATRDLMRAHHVPNPSELIPAIPSEIDEIVLRTLRIRPEARFQTASDLTSALSRIRALLFPETNARRLGEWVVRLIETDKAATRAIEEEIPDSADFSEVISQAIVQSIEGKVETIATRAPGIFKPVRRPRTGSQPLDAHVITGDLVPLGGTPPPVAPAAVLANTPVASEPVVSSMSEATFQTSYAHTGQPFADNLQPNSLFRTLTLALAVFLVTLLVALPWWIEFKRRTEAQEKREQAQRLKEQALGLTRPQTNPSIVGRTDFGARPCPADVKINGQKLQKPTPIYDHPLKPGIYSVTMIGKLCPHRNKPPRLKQTIEVKYGERLKIVADFDKQGITVKPAPDKAP